MGEGEACLVLSVARLVSEEVASVHRDFPV